ncbi:MAG TPA: NAD(P)-dependent oxidoreductase [Planctomycetota bacterium]|nr:NAD(P)-dependent oxidoreductase [Planctomycetota bacterium]
MDTHRAKPVVIVTGSSGLLGAAVLDRLKDRHQVVGFDRDGVPQPPAEIECVCVDLTDARSVALGLERVAYAYGKRLAAVVHLAAYYDFSGEPSPLYEEVNVRGTSRLLHGLRNGGFGCELFLYASSMLVHAPSEPGRAIDESSPIQAKWDYPRSKVDAEHCIEEEHGPIRAVVLRIAGIYTDRCESIPLSQQIHRIERRSIEAFVYPGDTSHGQSYVHVDDVVSAIELAITHRCELPPGVTPVLVGEPETPSYAEIQNRLGQLLHGEQGWPTHVVPKPLAKVGAWLQDKLPVDQFVRPWMIELADDHYELDVSRADQLLGWRPAHHVLDSLPDMVEDLRADPEAWHRRHGLGPP